MIPIPKAVKPPKIETIDVTSWEEGVVSELDDGRTPTGGLRSSSNTILDQDGTVRPRPSLQRYGPQPVGTVLGQIFQFQAISGLITTNWLICLQDVGGEIKAYIAKPEDATWTACDGATYGTGARGHFNQVANKVLICTPTDTISYLDISTVGGTPTVTTFDALDDPSAPTGTATGLTGSSFSVWYAVAANSTVGTTAASTPLKIDVSTPRSNWADDGSQKVTLSWTTVDDVQSWNVYAGVTADGSGTPTLYAIATNLPADTLTFIDDGSADLQTLLKAPTDNSTSGPKAERAEIINGQVWLTGDADHPYWVWYGGSTPGYELDFSSSHGGGNFPVGDGTGGLPVRVWNFRSGQGDAEIKCVTREVSGVGKRYTISSQTVTFNSITVTVWGPQEDYGYSGTLAPDGLIVYGNSTYYPSQDGFKTTGTKPQLQNLLSTDTVSDTIQNDLNFLTGAAMDKCVGLGFEGRLYWALPVGTDRNNQIWVLDIERKGAWMKPWTISADWMLIAEDNSGYIHHLILSNNILYELSYSTKTNDDGISFPTSGNTGITYFSADGRTWARLIRLVIELLRPQGTVNFLVTGYTNDKKIVPLGSGSISANTSSIGFGWNERGWTSSRNMGWNRFNAFSGVTADATQDVPIKINKDVRFFSVSWSSVESNVDYNISKIVAEYVSVGIKNLT